MSLPPFAAGSISLGLSAVGSTGGAVSTGVDVMSRLAQEAVAAVESGFDGVTLSEHHGGFPNYLPSPLAVAGGLLGKLSRGWAVAAPAILPLRAPLPVAEDLAWLSALYPGRVGAAFVPGYQKRDFDLLGVDFESRHTAFWAGLSQLVGAFRPTGPLSDDPALAAGRDVPLLAGVGGPTGARRAARLGLGLLVTSLRGSAEVRTLTDQFRADGGTGPTVLIRRVHVGESPPEGFDASMSDWRPQSDGSATWLSAAEGALVTGSADEVAHALTAAQAESGCDALNLRLDVHAARPEVALEQIEVLSASVLPAVRAAATQREPV